MEVSMWTVRKEIFLNSSTLKFKAARREFDANELLVHELKLQNETHRTLMLINLRKTQNIYRKVYAQLKELDSECENVEVFILTLWGALHLPTVDLSSTKSGEPNNMP